MYKQPLYSLLMQIAFFFNSTRQCVVFGIQSCLTLCKPMDYSPPGPLSLEISRQQCYSKLPFSSPGDHPDQGIKTVSSIDSIGGRILYHQCLLERWVRMPHDSVVSISLRSDGLQPTRLLCSWDSTSKNTGVGCHAFLQGTFPSQASNLCLPWPLPCRQILYC